MEDGPRCQDAGVPEGVVFRTQPELAREMIADAIAAGVPFRWVGGDSVYGDNPTFVQGVRRLGKWYVLDIACDTQVWTQRPEVIPADQRPKPSRGRRPTQPRIVGERRRVDEVIAYLPATAWHRVVVGDGTKGPRVYEYAEVTVWFREDERPGITRATVSAAIPEPGTGGHVPPVQCPADVGREKLAEIRGRRWTIEEDFQIGKGECGLDEYETRGWVGWHHHTALSMLALAFLVLQKHRLGEKRAPDDRSRSAGSPHAPVGRSGMERGGDPEVVPLATREESAGGRQPSKTTRRSRLTSLVG
ncbi:transposase [Fimbriiglobus ruber]|uniref:IS701 family transposase n=1 Tax=Fimbriiglobus ruber TaxID=1908690 RepID=UPI0021BCAFA0|nr:transposase [Fimbriiglobus ruber]